MTFSSDPILQMASLFIKRYKMEFEFKELVNFIEVIWEGWHLYLSIL